jgi:hypothetical protein
LKLNLLKSGQNPQKVAKTGDSSDAYPPERGRKEGFFKSVAGD